jgi:hypothetical protein
MHARDVEGLDPTRTYWVPAVVSPRRDWAGVPGCRKGSRYMVDRETLRPTRQEFGTFDSELSCLQWIMRNRSSLNRNLAGAAVRAVKLDRWLLGLE